MASAVCHYVIREVGDAIPVPLDPLRDFVSAARDSIGDSAPDSFEVSSRRFASGIQWEQPTLHCIALWHNPHPVARPALLG